MAFGPVEARRIRNPVCEPLWSGRRALVDVTRFDVTIRNENGDELEGFDDLRSAIAEASRAVESILDGYLVPAPLRSTAGVRLVPGQDSMVTPGQLTRQMFLGGGGRNERAEAIERERARQVAIHPEAPTAFVAVDLLWLDGEPLLDVPLLERKRLLESVLEDTELVRRTVAVRPPVEAWYAQWRALGFVEVAIKDANGRYTPGGVSRDWAISLMPRR
jgi:ATP dependent DNA ligase domain